jgi:hypothetical protein
MSASFGTLVAFSMLGVLVVGGLILAVFFAIKRKNPAIPDLSPNVMSVNCENLVALFPDMMYACVEDALYSSRDDLEGATTRLHSTARWLKTQSWMHGDLARVGPEGRMIRQIAGCTETHFNKRLCMNVTGNFVLFDLEAWNTAGLHSCSIEQAADSICRLIVRVSREQRGIAIIVRPNFFMLSTLRQLVNKLVPVLDDHYGGMITSVWLLPSDWSTRVAYQAAMCQVDKHAPTYTLNVEDLCNGVCNKVQLSPDKLRMFRKLVNE